MIPLPSSEVPKPLAGPEGRVASAVIAEPPPRTMSPPDELQVLEDHPEQMAFEAPNLIPPPLVASESDQMVIGPPLARRFTEALLRMLLLDFRFTPSPTPVEVMVAPTVASELAPVADREVDPPEVMTAPVLIEEQWIVTSPPAEIVPEELLAKVPESQVTVRPESPLIAAFTVTLLPVELRFNELEALGEATAFETVMEPAVCKVALAEPI